MHPRDVLRAWVQRAVRLGPARLALGLSILLALPALALPVWSMGAFTGNTQDVSSFSWTTMATDRFRNGIWTQTTIVPYGSSPFPAIGGVLGLSYALDVAFLLLAAVVFYPIVAIPGAATTDLGTFTVGGFWGNTNTGSTQWSWGAGLGWWFVLISVVLGIFGASLPYLKSIRSMTPPPPPEDWTPPAR